MREVKTIETIGNVKVYRATFFEKLCGNVLPYCLFFLPRRFRYSIRRHFHKAYQRRLMKDMTNALSDRYIKPIPRGYYERFKIEEFDWEVIPPTQENSDV